MAEKILIGTLTVLISVFFLPVFLIVSIGRFFAIIFEDWRVIGWAVAIIVLGLAVTVNLIHHWAFSR